MSAIIFLSIVAAVIVAGLLFYRRERNKQKTELERKLKVAEGTFDAAQATKPERKWWQRKKKKTSEKPPLPEDLARQLREQVPPFIDRLMKAYHAHKEAYNAEYQAYSAWVETKVFRVAIPAKADSDHFAGWLANATSRFQTMREAQRTYRAQSLALNKSRVLLAKLRKPLSVFIEGLNQFDLEDCPIPLLHTIDIAKTALNECPTIDEPRRDKLDDELAEPDAPDEEAVAICAAIVDSFEKVFVACGELSAKRAVLARQSEQLEQMRDKLELAEPERPSEQDVQTFLAQSLEWAADERRQCTRVQSSVNEVRAASAACSHLLSDLQSSTGLLAKLPFQRSTQKQADSSQDDVVETVSQTVAATPPQPVGTVREPYILGGQVQPAEERKPQTFAPWWDVDQPETLKKKRSATAQKRLRKNLLTEEQEATHNIGCRLADAANELIQSANATCAACGAEIRRTTIEGEPAGQEATVETLSAAMRKLGFAIAQKNAACSKLETAKQEPAKTSEPAQAPGLDETNVEAYIRLHRKWSADLARSNQASSERTERIQALAQQATEREKQVPEAAVALRSLVIGFDKDGPKGPLAEELDDAVRAARLLQQKYVPRPPAPPPSPPAPRRTSSRSHFEW